MASQKIDKTAWQGLFDRISRALTGKRAEIEAASLSLGDQIAAEWQPFLGISYDPKDDLVEVALEGIDHLIHAPQEVYADIGASGLETLEIVDKEGTRQIVRLREALMLPSPAAQA